MLKSFVLNMLRIKRDPLKRTLFFSLRLLRSDFQSIMVMLLNKLEALQLIGLQAIKSQLLSVALLMLNCVSIFPRLTSDCSFEELVLSLLAFSPVAKRMTEISTTT